VRGVIAPSFGEIFAQNAVKNGLRTVGCFRNTMPQSLRPQSPLIHNLT
jgi:3-isopropylmalate dehydratase small subunit